jgi:outer membrane protein OmpA-like peptidoglycan-associated protein
VLSFSKVGYKVKRLRINTLGLKESKDTALIVELVKGNSLELDGRVIDALTKESIASAGVLVDYESENYKEELSANEDGRFTYISGPNDKIKFTASHPGYFSRTVPTQSHKRGEVLTIELTPIELNKPIEIEPIYYDFDKWMITAQAEVTLDKIVSIMQENPSITIELSSHTDIRGTDNYNYDLSIKRAKEAIKYLVSEGIDRIRLTYNVYGEKQVAVPCPPDVDCDEEVHQKNRRTEFRVTSF